MLPTRKPTLRVAWYISTNQASEHTRSNWSGTRKNKSITTLVLLLIFVLKLNQKRNNKRIKTFILWTFCFWKVFGAFDFVSVVVVFSFTPVWSLILLRCSTVLNMTIFCSFILPLHCILVANIVSSTPFYSNLQSNFSLVQIRCCGAPLMICWYMFTYYTKHTCQ